MRFALLNPDWSDARGTAPGCREPHIPTELGCARELLRRAGHEARVLDGHLHRLSPRAMADRLAAFRPDVTVVTTAPGYLAWRTPPTTLAVPRRLLDAVRPVAGTLVAVGPHGSTTPGAALQKLDVHAVILGEPEEILVKLSEHTRDQWSEVPSIAWREDDGAVRVTSGPHASRLENLPPLRWPDEDVAAHAHHHHAGNRGEAGRGPGAEVEASRGCPYRCTFCNREAFRGGYRRRPLLLVLEEIDALLAQGVRYLYFIDEIFSPDRPLLEALAGREVSFGVQLRIDGWTKEMLDLLGRAGCVSIEAGIESVDDIGRSLLERRCALSTAQLTELLLHARKRVPSVEASLIATASDDAGRIGAWSDELARHGVRTVGPAPLYPYPGTPDYRQRFGPPDDEAWERAERHHREGSGEAMEVAEVAGAASG